MKPSRVRTAALADAATVEATVAIAAVAVTSEAIANRDGERYSHLNRKVVKKVRESERWQHTARLWTARRDINKLYEFFSIGACARTSARLRVLRIHRTNTDSTTGNSRRPQRPRSDRLCRNRHR